LPEFKPTAWVRTNCPYSFKFRLFVTEAGISDQFQFVAMDPDSPDFARVKSEIDRRSGRKTVFPTVEVAPNEFLTDSEALINHFSAEHGIDASDLPTLTFYRNGLYVCYIEMFSILASPLGWIARLGRRPKAFR
jgi:hypothetical protein